MGGDVEIQEQRQGAVTVVRPGGPLCGVDADQFRAHADGLMRRTLGRFVVDAGAIQFADSRGLEVLVEIGQDLSQSGQTLRMCGCGETLREIFELTGVESLFDHHLDVTAAVRSFL
jgi:anti-sigma B factor antagonist